MNVKTQVPMMFCPGMVSPQPSYCNVSDISAAASGNMVKFTNKSQSVLNLVKYLQFVDLVNVKGLATPKQSACCLQNRAQATDLFGFNIDSALPIVANFSGADLREKATPIQGSIGKGSISVAGGSVRRARRWARAARRVRAPAPRATRSWRTRTARPAGPAPPEPAPPACAWDAR
ncbi:unnamed protein product, partial [Brenthis ino]